MLLVGEKVRLRALEPQDVDILYEWENNPSVWGVSGTLAPFSRAVLGEFVENQKQDIYQTRQMRLVVSRLEDGKPVGAIDLFDFDPVNMRAGVGILIADRGDRGEGYASEALGLVCDYAAEVLCLHQLHSSVCVDNVPGVALFRGKGFVEIGVRREWTRRGGTWHDEMLFQRVFASS